MFERRDLFGVPLLVATAIVVSSCGGQPLLGPGGDDAATAGKENPPLGGGIHSPCPASVPVADTPCDSSVTDVCEYPTTGRPRCPVEATCLSDLWAVDQPRADCGTAPLPCPATFPSTTAFVACNSSAAPPFCDYDQGRCECIGCINGSIDGVSTMVKQWRCSPWDSIGGGCPTAQPLVGSPCSLPGLICDYLLNSTCVNFGRNVACVDGFWLQDFSPPPPMMICPDECRY